MEAPEFQWLRHRAVLADIPRHRLLADACSPCIGQASLHIFLYVKALLQVMRAS